MLTNRIIIITGAQGLLGRNFCKALLTSGATVVSGDINSQGADTLGSELTEEEYGRFIHYDLDITSTLSVNNFLDQVLDKFGRIDGLINNAYPRNKGYGNTFFDISYEDFCENISMNLGGYFLMSKELVARALKAHFPTSIVNMASIYGIVAPKFEIYKGTSMTMPVEYSVIKSGLIHLTKYMAKYFKGKNIRVNSLSPGGIFDHQDDNFVKSYNNSCLNKGMLNAQDLNGTILFLLSDQSQYINGQNITVDDGFTL